MIDIGLKFRRLHWIQGNLLIALAYLLPSLVSLTTAMPPGFAAPFWPAAGFALALLISTRRRYSLGIFLGSWMSNVCHSDVLGKDPEHLLLIMTACVFIGCGAALQALAGRQLTHRFCEKSLRLDSNRSVLFFQFLVIPFSGLISASVGVVSLVLFHQIDRNQAPLHWFTWWIGDVLGMAILAPMLLSFWGKPKQLWRPRRITLCLPGLFILGGLILLFSKTADWQSDKQSDFVGHQADRFIEDLITTIQKDQQLLQSLQWVLEGRDELSRAEFQRFATFALKMRPGLQGLLVMPHSERSIPKDALIWTSAAGHPESNRVWFDEVLKSNAEFSSILPVRLSPHLIIVERQSIVSGSGKSYNLLAIFNVDQALQYTLPSYADKGLQIRFEEVRGAGSAPVPFFGISTQRFIPGFSKNLRLRMIRSYDEIFARISWEYYSVLILGLIFTLVVFSFLLVASGQSYRFETLFNERSAELKLQEAKAEHAIKMAALGALAGSIAHEINNPLAIIHGYANLLLRRLERGLLGKEELKNALIKMETTCRRISDIISALRSYARDDTKDQIIPCCALDLIDETLELCQQLVKQKNIQIRWQRQVLESTMIMGRKASLMQVLLNLIGNACDAITQLPEKWIRLDVSTQGEQIFIRVTDSGQGIASELREKIMQPFFTTKPAGQGTGLGLSVSRGLMEAMGGSLVLDVNSKNTSFVIAVPKAPLHTRDHPHGVGACVQSLLVNTFSK